MSRNNERLGFLALLVSTALALMTFFHLLEWLA